MNLSTFQCWYLIFRPQARKAQRRRWAWAVRWMTCWRPSRSRLGSRAIPTRQVSLSRKVEGDATAIYGMGRIGYQCNLLSGQSLCGFIWHLWYYPVNMSYCTKLWAVRTFGIPIKSGLQSASTCSLWVWAWETVRPTCWPIVDEIVGLRWLMQRTSMGYRHLEIPSFPRYVTVSGYWISPVYSPPQT